MGNPAADACLLPPLTLPAGKQDHRRPNSCLPPALRIATRTLLQIRSALGARLPFRVHLAVLADCSISAVDAVGGAGGGSSEWLLERVLRRTVLAWSKRRRAAADGDGSGCSMALLDCALLATRL